MKPLHKKIAVRNKNNKLLYYLKVLAWQFMPSGFFRLRLPERLKKLDTLTKTERNLIFLRVNYYNKLQTVKPLLAGIMLGKLRLPKKQKAYYFDTQEYTRYFNTQYKANFLFGDVTQVYPEPTIVKSRPINKHNENSVILKLDKLRHFNFVTDSRAFEDKKNMLVGRGVIKKEHRIRFYERHFNNPMCNLGQINRGKNEHWIRDFLTIDEHLEYKFILCLEGNDVATNLKWVMSSNSLAVMPKPKFETWFMEGTLVANQHYVEIKDDYSDLEERLNYYINNPHEALYIIRQAHDFVSQFQNKEREDLISLLVLEKYFYKTGQHTPEDPFRFKNP